MSRMLASTHRTQLSLQSFVLHRYDWSESSVILDLFTREQGRLAVIAKGAKRPYSQLRSVLLPFQHINVSLVRAHGTAEQPEVQSLRAAEWTGGAPMLSGAALFAGFYCNELLLRMLARNDPHPQLFDTYALTLPLLAAEDDRKVQTGLRAFELVLLKEVGVLPDLSRVTVTQQPVGEDDVLALLPDVGVMLARPGDTILCGRALLGLQAAIEHGSLLALHHACSAVLVELKATLRTLLHYHLGTPVLRTRQVMLDLQAL